MTANRNPGTRSDVNTDRPNEGCVPGSGPRNRNVGNSDFENSDVGNHSGEQSVLLVGVCVGQRCAALRRLNSADSHRTGVNPTRTEPAAVPESEQLLRQAVRARHKAVLVSVPCLGPCSQASVTVVGAGLARENSLTWLGCPSTFGLTQIPQRARALADWVGADAPNPQNLPAALRRSL